MSQQVAIILILIVGILFVGLMFLLIKFYKQNGRLLRENRQFEYHMHERVQELCKNWQVRECDSIRLSERDLAMRDANVQLQQWKVEFTRSIRNEAIQGSQSVIIGKVTEHLVPYFPNFNFNPKDVRFIGSPIDLIVFDGMNNEEIQDIVFVEVKTGTSASLTKRERQIRDAIKNQRVRWLELRIDRSA